MVERHPYTVDTGVQFSNEVPDMQRWQRGPMHGIANPENREFKSHPLLQNIFCQFCQNIVTTSTKCTIIDL